MVIKRSTGLLFGVAIALVAAVGILEANRQQQPQDSVLYDFTEAEVTALTVRREDLTLEFAKADDGWQMSEPEAAPADPAAVAFLLNLLTTDPITETISVLPEKLDTYGLDTPSATLELVANQQNYQLRVGDDDFSGSSVYVTTETPEADAPLSVHAVPIGTETGIQRPLAEWLATPETDSDDSDAAEP